MRYAIIDIGSNATRTVVYDSLRLGATEIFNSKFKSDILNLLAMQSFEVKHQFYLSIQHLLSILHKLEVTQIKCVATAVLRDHPKADDFIKYIRTRYKFDINIITGDEEARLTAQGLMVGIPECSGILVDLGGGSLELAEVDKDKVGKLQSLELGTKILDITNIDTVDQIVHILVSTFNSKQYPNIYFIGGALRFLGRIYIDFTRYPIRNLHNLEIPVEAFVSYLTKIQLTWNQHNSLNSNTSTIERINTKAVLVAQAVIEVFRPAKIIISTYGLKEGVRFDSLPTAEKTKNLIEDKIICSTGYSYATTNFDQYFTILQPLINYNQDYKLVLKLAIMLAPLKQRFDRTLSSQVLEDYILYSAIPFHHKTRVMLALIIAYSVNRTPSINLTKLMHIFLTPSEQINCKITGYFLYIAEEIDGPSFIMPSFEIRPRGRFLELHCREMLPRPIFERIRSILKLMTNSDRTPTL